MHRRTLTTLLLLPSLLSGSITFLLSAAVVIFTGWASLSPDNPLFNYLFGPYGLTTIFQESANLLTAINGAFSNPASYNIAVVIFALFVGLSVYVLLEGLDHLSAKAQTAISEVKYVHDPTLRHRMKIESEVRLGLRTATLIVWIVYTLLFAHLIVPYCILLGRLENGGFFTSAVITKGIAAFALLATAIHLHIIFMRLLVLRPRLFGEQNVIVGRGGHEE